MDRENRGIWVLLGAGFILAPGASALAGNNVASEVRSFTVDNTKPTFTFPFPTEDNGTTINENHTYINVTVTDSSNTSAFIDWNRSLVGYWSFDSYNSTGVYDNSTYSNFGTFGGGLGTSNLTTGKYGNALEFDGTDDYVDCGNDASLNITDAITIEAWIYPETLGVNNMGTILGKGISAYFFGLYAGPAIRFYASSGAIDYMSESNSIELNKWQHVVVTYDKQNVIFYVNGIVKTTNPETDAITTNSAHVFLGDRDGNGGRDFDGIIDSVRVYNRDLSPQEINASFNNGIWRLENNFTDLADGTYDYYVGAIDSAGNFNVSGTRTLTVDTVAPTITWNTPANDNSTIVSGTLIHNITFADTNLYMLNCTIYNDSAMTNAVWSIQVNLSGNETWTLENATDISTWPDGTYYENCTITDLG